MNFSNEINELIEDFSFFDSWEDKYQYLIDMGRNVPQMDEALKTEENKMKGCQSLVYFYKYYNDDGTITTWGFEGEGPQDMMHGGVRKGDLPPGAKITITGNPMRDGRPAAMWQTIIKEDGTLLNWRTPGRD